VWLADCSDVNKDVVFAVDSSWKPADNQSWFYILSFLHDVVNELRITKRTTRIGVLRYSDTANLSIALNHVDHVQRLINELRYDGDETSDGSSDLAYALDVTRSRVFDGARDGTRRVVVVITEHLQASPQLSAAVGDVRSSGIELIVVAVTGYGGVEVDTLSKISSETSRVDDYHKLTDKTAEVVQYVCDGKHERQTPTPRGKSPSIANSS